jgi:hypothetical protein
LHQKRSEVARTVNYDIEVIDPLFFHFLNFEQTQSPNLANVSSKIDHLWGFFSLLERRLNGGRQNIPNYIVFPILVSNSWSIIIISGLHQSANVQPIIVFYNPLEKKSKEFSFLSSATIGIIREVISRLGYKSSNKIIRNQVYSTVVLKDKSESGFYVLSFVENFAKFVTKVINY